jgi:nucleotide-binding universal stress UspA family protein
MAKYNRLLVGLDGSETSLHALRESFKLSQNWVTVLTVAPSYAGDLRIMGVSGIREKLREPCDTALALAQEMADAAGALIRPLCTVGEPYECLVAEAESGSRDLLYLQGRPSDSPAHQHRLGPYPGGQRLLSGK